MAGGVVLSRTALQRRRKLLGIPLPGTVDVGLGGVGHQIGKAGERFGKVAGEMVEKVAGALS